MQNQGLSTDTKTIITILLLIFVYPIGLILMFVWMRWPKWLKTIITIPLILLIAAIILFIYLFKATSDNPKLVNKVGQKIVELNPELAQKTRDTTRRSDLSKLNFAITIAHQDSIKLCGKEKIPCYGNSNEFTTKLLDGSGWVKVDLINIESGLDELPIDPINNKEYQYRCSDGKSWE